MRELRAEIGEVEESVLDALAAGERIDARALLFLLRLYQCTGRDDLASLVGDALAVALDASASASCVPARAAWLDLFVDASALTEDERIRGVIDQLVMQLHDAWESAQVGDVVLAVGACLRAAACTISPDHPDYQPAVAAAIDRLERVVGGAYRPGKGVGEVADQVRTASTLLTAFRLSGRLPYSMLAEELIQLARGAANVDFTTSCDAARVLCELAVLHEDHDYRRAAVVTPDADYRRDAEQLLMAQSDEAHRLGAAGAIYGVALLELESAKRESVTHPMNDRIPALMNIATRLRIDSIRSTSAAGSGHPTSCMSMADLMAALFFSEMRFDPKDPHNPEADRFVLSKGHAAPILYAAWAEAGAFDRAELLTLRQIGSDLEGHPTPRLPFVDVATGSLGQGICAAIGTALNARRIQSDYRTYVLLGDGETAEGSVWEAANLGTIDGLDNLCAITDVNGLGQSRPTMWQHDMEQFARRWRAFGWHAIVIDGHDMRAILDAFEEARKTTGQPTMILARTVKGKGVSFVEGKEGWHGKPFKAGEEMDRAIAELERQIVPVPEGPDLARTIARPRSSARPVAAPKPIAPPTYKMGEEIATREAYGVALAKLGEADPRVVALDADVKNSTFSDKFEKAFPGRFYENFIAEQVMVGVAMGLAARGAIPFPSTFACFLSRAADFIRMAAISNVNVKLAGSHAGISIGEDGPSQMALEDLAMFRAQPNYAVLYPCDGVSAERLVALAAYHPGPAYIRTSRPKTPVIYANDEVFELGGSKVLRQSPQDVATIIGAGVTVFEALKAYDQLKAAGTLVRVIDLYSLAPVDREGLVAAARATGGHLITVEDHYSAGGVGDAVAGAVADSGFTVQRLAVREIPRSGTPEALLERFGISASHIVTAVRGVTVGAR